MRLLLDESVPSRFRRSLTHVGERDVEVSFEQSRVVPRAQVEFGEAAVHDWRLWVESRRWRTTRAATDSGRPDGVNGSTESAAT
jgi:hypothetical protein